MAQSFATGDSYVLGRNYRASLRLNLMHWLMKEINGGFLLHPKIQYHENMTISDVGAGTAIWLQELALALPQSRLHGFDISSEQYPPINWRAQNLTLSEYDVFQPPPAEHLEAYDVINIRFFRCIVTSDNAAKKIIENLSAMLKPHGYLQWFDTLSLEGKIDSPDPNIPAPGSEKLLQMTLGRGSEPSAEWTSKIPQFYTEHGLTVVAEDHYYANNAYKLIWAQQVQASFDEIALSAEQGRVDYIDSLKEQLMKEMQMGVTMVQPWFCALGRKNL